MAFFSSFCFIFASGFSNNFSPFLFKTYLVLVIPEFPYYFEYPRLSGSAKSSSSEDTESRSASLFFVGDFVLFFKIDPGATGALAPPSFDID